MVDALTTARPPTLRGASVGGFVLETRLGGGGGGAVWRARGAGGEPFAVKILHAPLVDEAARRRFARERGTLERLAPHPAIVPLVASGVEPDGTAWLATPLYRASLAERLASVGTLAPTTAARLGARLAAALAHAHAHAVVHGDVKPANTLLDDAGRAVLGDFGASVLEDATLTRTCALSPGWAAPERCGGAPPTVASDLYGLGATLRRALHGETPVDERAATGDAVAPLEALVETLTHADPAARPSSAADVLERLRTIVPDAVDELAGERRSAPIESAIDASPPPASTPERSLPTPAERVARGARPNAPLVLVTLCGAALALGFALGRERPSSTRSATADATAATFDCPPGAYLCERFDEGAGDWIDEGVIGAARYTIAPRDGDFGADGALTREPGTSTEFAASSFSHPIAAPPPGGALRLRTRVAVARDTADAPDVWLHLLRLHSASGHVWSVNLGGYGTAGMTVDGYYYDAGGPNDVKFHSGTPRRVDAPICLEAIVRPSGTEDALEFAVYVDGTFVGGLDHPPTTRRSEAFDRFDVYLGMGADPARDAPEVVYDEIVVDTVEQPGCGA